MMAEIGWMGVVFTTEDLLREIRDRNAKQRDIALSYALAINCEPHVDYDIDWPSVNRAIIKRWSQSGLQRIKKMAWGKWPHKRQEEK